jgi:hypothetical protein
LPNLVNQCFLESFPHTSSTPPWQRTSSSSADSGKRATYGGYLEQGTVRKCFFVLKGTVSRDVFGYKVHNEIAFSSLNFVLLFGCGIAFDWCISADQRAKDQRATRQLDFKSSNNLHTIAKKLLKNVNTF